MIGVRRSSCPRCHRIVDRARWARDLAPGDVVGGIDGPVVPIDGDWINGERYLGSAVVESVLDGRGTYRSLACAPWTLAYPPTLACARWTLGEP